MTRQKGGELNGSQQGHSARWRGQEARPVDPESWTIAGLAAATGIPVPDWVGDCFGICLAIADRHLVAGKLVHGVYYGPVDPRSPFLPPPKPWTYAQEKEYGPIDGLEPDEIAFEQGYILLPDGRVFDPTRWTFEMVRPYVYIGPADEYEANPASMRLVEHYQAELEEGGRAPYTGDWRYCSHEYPRYGAMLTVRDPWFDPLRALAKGVGR